MYLLLGIVIGILAGVFFTRKIFLNSLCEHCKSCKRLGYTIINKYCYSCGCSENKNNTKVENNIKDNCVLIFSKIRNMQQYVDCLKKKFEDITIKRSEYNYSSGQFTLENLDFNKVFENVNKEILLENLYNSLIITLGNLSCSMRLISSCAPHIDEEKINSKLFNKHLENTFTFIEVLEKTASRCYNFFDIIKDIRDNPVLIEKIGKNIESSVEGLNSSIKKLNDSVILIANINNYSEEEIKERTEKLNNLSISLKIFKDLEGESAKEELKNKQKEYMEKS